MILQQHRLAPFFLWSIIDSVHDVPDEVSVEGEVLTMRLEPGAPGSPEESFAID